MKNTVITLLISAAMAYAQGGGTSGPPIPFSASSSVGSTSAAEISAMGFPLPSNTGTIGQYLTPDGVGNFTWQNLPPITDTYIQPGSYDASTGSVTLPLLQSSNGSAVTWGSGVVITGLGTSVDIATGLTDSEANPTYLLNSEVADERYRREVRHTDSLSGLGAQETFSFDPSQNNKNIFASVPQFTLDVYYVGQASSGRSGYYRYMYNRQNGVETVHLSDSYHGLTTTGSDETAGDRPSITFTWVSSTQVDVTITNNWGGNMHYNYIFR